MSLLRKITLRRKFFLIVSLTLLALFFLAACGKQNALQHLPKMADGTHLERFVPKESFLVASLAPTSVEEQQLLHQHSQTIFQNYEQLFSVSLFKKIFREEAVPLFSTFFTDRNPPIILALHPDETRARSLGFFVTAYLDLKDAEALRGELLTKREEFSEDIILEERDGKLFFTQKKPDLYGFLEGSYFFLSTSSELLPNSLTPSDPPLFDDAHYLSFLRNAPSSFSAYFYSKLTDSVSEVFENQLGFAVQPSLFPKETSSIAFVQSELGGLRMTSFSKAPRGKDVDPLLQTIVEGSPAMLGKHIKAENIGLFAEGFNFGNQIRLQQKIILEDPFFATREGKQFFQDLEKKFGISFEKDLFPTLSRNYAMLFEDQGKILPAISFWIDASANREGAEKIVKQLDTVLGSLVTVAQLGLVASGQDEDPPENFLERKEAGWGEDKMHQLVFYPKRLFENQPTIPLFNLADETWHLTYGLLKNRFLVISTREVLPSKSFAEAESYQNLLPEIAGFSETDQAFIDPAVLIQYAERIIMLAQSSGHLTARQLEIFETVKTIAKPVKGFISGTNRRGDLIENQAFIFIGA